MRLTKIVFLLVLSAVPAVASAQAATTVEAAKAEKYSVEETDLGTLLDNPETKAVLVKLIPDVVSNPQISMARGMTLAALQSYVAEQLTDEVLGKIQAEFSKIPSKK